MDFTKQVTKWVERNFGKVIFNELKHKILEEDSPFDAEGYANELIEGYFDKNDVENIKKEILDDQIQYNFSNSGSELSKKAVTCNLYSNESSLDSLELEQNELNTFSPDDIINGLKSDSIEVQENSLRNLESSADELINPTNWIVFRKIFENLLLEARGNTKIQNLILKIFQKFMSYPNKPKMVCEVFTSLTEIVSFHIELTNLDYGRISFEEIYDLKEEKWVGSGRTLGTSKRTIVDIGVIIKSMWLLIECQKQMPEKWIRFNENRLREIIFSFIYLLSCTTILENKILTGLELLSVLNPTASWCRHWCHTAIGRSLLCSAFRKYKNFFIQVVEIILFNIKVKKVDKTIAEDSDSYKSSLTGNHSSPSLKPLKQTDESNAKSKNLHLCDKRIKYVRSAPIGPEKINSSRKNETAKSSKKSIFENIPPKIVAQAVFCHCMSLILCLIQFRIGRSLFPIQTSSRKRLLSVQDLAASMTDYLENYEFYECDRKKIIFSHEYRRQVLEMIKTLKSVKGMIHSSNRSAHRLPP